MAESLDEKLARLDELADELGVISAEDRKGMRAVLPALVERLSGDDRVFQLRAAQVMMAPVELPGLAGHPSIKAVLKVVREQGWGDAEVSGSKGGELSPLTALKLLVALAYFELPALKVVDGLGMTWQALHTQPSSVEQCMFELIKVDIFGGGQGIENKLARLSVVSYSADDVAKRVEKNLSKIVESTQVQYQGFLPQFKAVFTDLVSEQSKLWRGLQESFESFNGQLESVSNAQALQVKQATLLWWGQSRYSPTLRKPYRKLEDPVARVWWSAWDCAAYCTRLPLAPAGSYLVETLRAMGVDVEERRPLRAWMEELRAWSLEQGPNLAAMRPEWKQLVDEDALGLPVSWLRSRMVSRDASKGVSQDAREVIGVDLEQEIDRGDWAEWLLHELVLERRVVGEEA